MRSKEDQILRAAKEIIVKFIEAGRVSPTGFQEAFQSVYKTIKQTTREDNGVHDSIEDSE